MDVYHIVWMCKQCFIHTDDTMSCSCDDCCDECEETEKVLAAMTGLLGALSLVLAATNIITLIAVWKLYKRPPKIVPEETKQ